MNVDVSAAQGFDRAEALVERLLEQAGFRPDKVIGVGLGVPGRSTWRPGRSAPPRSCPAGRASLRAVNSPPGWAWRSTSTTTPTSARWATGLGRRARLSDLAYIKVASGVGSGLVINGQIYRGPGGTAGEIGHITLDESGPVCRCGNRGCLETFVGSRYLLNLLNASHERELTLSSVVQLAQDGIWAAVG